MDEDQQRERESRDSPETKYEEAVEAETEERRKLAERLDDPPPPEEENEGD